MNLKQSFKIIDARRGVVRKKSKIKDNGWRGFIDTPDDQKVGYLWNYANEQEKLSGELNKMQRDFVDVFAKEKPNSVIYESDEDGGGINYYDTLRYARWRDPDFKEVYAKNIQPFESDLNRRTADINMMNEHLGYPIGFESGHKPYWIKKQGIGDSARVNDMAVRDMAVRNKEAINNAAAARNSDFVANNPWIYNLTADPNAQAVVDAVDFFDTVEHLVKQGYNDWVNDAIEECRKAVDLGVDRAKRTLYIWGYKRVDVRGVPIVDVRIEYTPDKLQLRLWDNHAAIGGDASNEEMGEFIKLFNTLTCVNDEEPDERITAFTEQFFGMVEGEFGSSYGTDEVAQ